VVHCIWALSCKAAAAVGDSCAEVRLKRRILG